MVDRRLFRRTKPEREEFFHYHFAVASYLCESKPAPFLTIFLVILTVLKLLFLLFQI